MNTTITRAMSSTPPPSAPALKIGGACYHDSTSPGDINHVAPGVLAEIFNVLGAGPRRRSKLMWVIGGDDVRATPGPMNLGPTRTALNRWLAAARPELSGAQADHAACVWMNAHRDLVFALDYLLCR
jgi:hypothetical protein